MYVACLLALLTSAANPAEPQPVPPAPANAPPVLQALTIAPAEPTTADALTCTPGETTDPDGDPVTVTLSWAIDGQHATDGPTLPATATHAGMRVRCTGTPNDGKVDGAPVDSATVTVANSPPTVAGVTLGPADPRRGTDLRCTPGATTDADGDAVTFRYAWTVDGKPAPDTEATLPGSALRRGQAIACTVTPTDGHDDGAPATSETAHVGNSPPTVAAARVDPPDPDVTRTVTCQADGVADADGDEVTLQVAWTVDGQPAGTDTTLSEGSFAKHQSVACTVTPSDGASTGAAVTSETVEVRDAPPVVSAITLLPADPDTDAILGATAEASDPDGDPVTLAWQWEVNGAPAMGVGAHLDGGTAFAHGDAVRAGVTPDDGERDGPLVWSTPVTIADTPPTAPSVGIEDPARNGGALVCRLLTPSTDLDGDPIGYRFAWTLGGEPYTELGKTVLPDDTVAAAAVHIDQEWSCTVTPSDGQVDGPASDPDRLVIISPTVGSGTSHTCALPADGWPVCWGNRDYGLTLPPEQRLRALSVGGWHNCGIRQRDDGIVCWGHDVYGQSDPPPGRFRLVAAGGWHTCALDEAGAITCWGQSADNRLQAPEGSFVAMSAGWKHTCALDAGGAITCWGADDAGQSDPPPGHYQQVSAGQTHTCALDLTGHVVCWGEDQMGSLDAPPGIFVQVVTGSRFSCALRADGTVACWGFDAYGQLDPPDARFRFLGRGVDGLCGWTTGGRVRCWGRDQQGEADPPLDLR